MESEYYYNSSGAGPTMNTPSVNSCGQRDIEGIVHKLNETYMEIMKNESRIWLIRSIADNGLSTRDIYSFAYKQARLRSYYKILDNQTVKSAMRAKLKDLRFGLVSTFKEKKHL